MGPVCVCVCAPQKGLNVRLIKLTKTSSLVLQLITLVSTAIKFESKAHCSRMVRNGQHTNSSHANDRRLENMSLRVIGVLVPLDILRKQSNKHNFRCLPRSLIAYRNALVILP